MPDHPTRADISLLDPGFHQDPFERYAWMRRHVPVYWDADARTWDGGRGYGVSRGTTTSGRSLPTRRCSARVTAHGPIRRRRRR